MLENYGAGVYGPYYYAGAPVAGTNEVQTATFGGTWLATETFRLVFGGVPTAAITWNATNATLLSRVQAALDAHPSLGTSWCVASAGTLTAGIGTMLLTFSGGDVSARDVGQMSVTGSTSAAGTLAIATTTPGVTATYRDVAKGAVLVDVSSGTHYCKTGNAGTGTYVKTGTQT